VLIILKCTAREAGRGEDDSKLSGAVNMPEGWDTIQKGLDKL